MAQVTFNILYYTHPNESVAVKIFLGKKTMYIPLSSTNDKNWVGNFETNHKSFSYAYAIESENDSITEYGTPRTITLHQPKCEVHDQWRARGDRKNIFSTAPFHKVFRKRTAIKTKQDKSANFIIRVSEPTLRNQFSIGVSGSIPSLGNWTETIPMVYCGKGQWEAAVAHEAMHPVIEYKFTKIDNLSGETVEWEAGKNRQIIVNQAEGCKIITDEGCRFQEPLWRSAGVAIPIFSLRSKKGGGIGEFLDLKAMIDLASISSLKIVQILPVNDTLATMSWKDSYPYAAISVMALHPLYIHIEKVGALNITEQKKWDKEKEKMNSSATVDFEKVLEHKMFYLKKLYKKYGKKTFAEAGYKKFYKENSDWLVAYAAFCYLRDINGTADFNKWSSHKKYDKEKIQLFIESNLDVKQEVGFYFFCQYHADKQLKSMKDYGRKKGVILKGDLPIGIFRYSCDAWMSPELYNMDEQAGAPPDDYAVQGQNWGFPTYNWETMAEDNFLWWRQRMQKLATYFDALRIDHILGFFRIWQIPLNQSIGTMGLFNPRMPYSQDEIDQVRIQDIKRFTHPYIRLHMLKEIFQQECDWVISNFLEEVWPGSYTFLEKYTTQQKIKTAFTLKKFKHKKHLQVHVQNLIGEILLHTELIDGEVKYSPRITLHNTYSFKSLTEYEQQIINFLYNDYYYNRHNEFWKEQALWKLPALLDSTDMLICGEDLGMIPASVPEVMRQLNIMPLEIQRMPKGSSRLGNPHAYDYFTVSSPSCHDMSTIRGWWSTDRSSAQHYYNGHLKKWGQAPTEASSEIVTHINQEHLQGPSMMVIIPLQDLLGMNDSLKNPDIYAEQINEPSNPDHYWRYRMHINLEDLLREKDFISSVKEMVEESYRD